jgi:hypothetical protein
MGGAWHSHMKTKKKFSQQSNGKRSQRIPMRRWKNYSTMELIEIKHEGMK